MELFFITVSYMLYWYKQDSYSELEKTHFSVEATTIDEAWKIGLDQFRRNRIDQDHRYEARIRKVVVASWLHPVHDNS